MCMVVFSREHARVAILAADIKRSFCAAWTVKKNGRSPFARQCAQPKESAIRRVVERQLGLTPELPVDVVQVPPLLVPPLLIPLLLRIQGAGSGTGGATLTAYRHCYFLDCLGSFVFAHCGGYEKALDFTRAGHRIVQSSLVFCSTGGICLKARTFIRPIHRNEVEQDTI